MEPKKNTKIALQQVLILVGGTLFLLISIGLLLVGGFSGLKDLFKPLVNAIRSAPSGPAQDPIAIPKYTEDNKYNKKDVKDNGIEIGEKSKDYGVELNLPAQGEADKIVDVTEYPIPTLNPWEVGGAEWQKEYWNSP